MTNLLKNLNLKVQKAIDIFNFPINTRNSHTMFMGYDF